MHTGLTGGLGGGLIGAVGSLATFGFGLHSGQLAQAAIGGLGLGIVVSPLGRFAACFAGAFIGTIVATVSDQTALLNGIGDYRGIGAQIANGLAFGLMAGLFVEIAGRRLPSRGTHFSASGMILGLMPGIVVWLALSSLGSTPAIISVGVISAATCSLVGAVLFETYPSDREAAVTPLDVLKRDRFTFFASGLGLAFAVSLTAGLALALLPIDAGVPSTDRVGHAVWAGIVMFVSVGIVSGFLQSCWGSFVIARAWLAVHGVVPWRLMRFLEDAHLSRGVLRLQGPVYQFRHLELETATDPGLHPVSVVGALRP